jgi:hypothetical protein
MYEKQYDIIWGILGKKEEDDKTFSGSQTLKIGGSQELFKSIQKKRKEKKRKRQNFFTRDMCIIYLSGGFLTLSIYPCKFLTFIPQGGFGSVA